MAFIRKKNKFIIVMLLIVLALAGWIYWGNQAIQVTHYNVCNAKIHEQMNGLTIVQVSDLHNAKFGEHQENLLSKVNAESPDLIVVTGDLIDATHTDIEAAMKFINGAVKIAPVYFVTGNHEAWSNDYAVLKELLEQAGVVILDNNRVTISRNGESICLLGVADPAFSEGIEYFTDAAVLNAEIETIPREADKYMILLSHRPEMLATYVNNNIDLALSGHAHGGQFSIPFIGGIVAPNQGVLPKYTAGVFEENQTKMIISRGLGNSIIPIRINNRPELVVITLTSGRIK